MGKTRPRMTTSGAHRAWGDWLEAHEREMFAILQKALKDEVHCLMEMDGYQLAQEALVDAFADWLDEHSDELMNRMFAKVWPQRRPEELR